MDKDTSPQQSNTMDFVDFMGEEWNNSVQNTDQTNENLQLEDIIQNKKRIVYFKKFLESLDAIENIKLWEDVEKFKKIEDPNKRMNEAERISKMYLSSNSDPEMNISSKTCKFIYLLI
jgi:hypothetical protein